MSSERLGKCKVLKSIFKDNTRALQGIVLTVVQEKCWTTAFFQAYTLGVGTGDFIIFYNLHCKGGQDLQTRSS